jgi:hypothetical protein
MSATVYAHERRRLRMSAAPSVSGALAQSRPHPHERYPVRIRWRRLILTLPLLLRTVEKQTSK